METYARVEPNPFAFELEVVKVIKVTSVVRSDNNCEKKESKKRLQLDGRFGAKWKNNEWKKMEKRSKENSIHRGGGSKQNKWQN
jgi:hypothetical protein